MFFYAKFFIIFQRFFIFFLFPPSQFSRFRIKKKSGGVKSGEQGG